MIVFIFLLFSSFLFSKDYGDIYIDASIGDASYLNPILASDSASAAVNSLVYNGLVKYDKDLILVGDLAERWGVKKGGKEIIFY
jgi:peptide/nickel transport system substrate-binding protein